MDNDQDQSSDGTVEFLLAEEAAAKGGHPAWQEILDAVPEEFREAIKPTLEKWDSGVQKRFQSIHSQYDPLKPYLSEDPERIEAALMLIKRIEEDPRAVYDLMAQTYQFNIENEGQGTPMAPQELDNEQDPYALQLKQQQQQIQELTAAQQELLQRQEQQRMADELDAYLELLHEEHGEFDDDYVITLMANGIEGPDAIGRYTQLVEKISGQTPTPQTPQQPAAPGVIGSGGGVPSRSIDPNSLKDSEVKDLVAQMLEQANKEST